MVLIAGANVVRFAPALIVSEEEVSTGLDRFALACEREIRGVIMMVIRPVERGDLAGLMQLPVRRGRADLASCR